jgi:hypothetical protein
MKMQANGFPREHTNIPDPRPQPWVAPHAPWYPPEYEAFVWALVGPRRLPQQDPRERPESR